MWSPEAQGETSTSPLRGTVTGRPGGKSPRSGRWILPADGSPGTRSLCLVIHGKMREAGRTEPRISTRLQSQASEEQERTAVLLDIERWQVVGSCARLIAQLTEMTPRRQPNDDGAAVFLLREVQGISIVAR